VPDGRSRLRLTARADLSDADLDRARSAFTAFAASSTLPEDHSLR